MGVPTFDGPYSDDVPEIMYDKNIDLDAQCSIEPRFFRRAHSFDMSDLPSSIHFEVDIDIHAITSRKSEPDLSKYGLFLETEVTMECVPQGSPLVLNNPFYDGSLAANPVQYDPAIVMMPENYLGFEDSFVPAWDQKSNDPAILPDFYYDGIPILPPNDPWTAYGNDNAGFDYYAPHYGNPDDVANSIGYMPLTDLEYAIPQYMSLPVIEQAKVENFSADHSSSIEVPTPVNNSVSETNNNVDISNQGIKTISLDEVPTSVSEVMTDDDKVSSTRESRTQSEESLNADISCDVTSSLAFVPNSQVTQDDATSDDTSPCSADYHEASALDALQGLTQLERGDSSDFSQSRDDTEYSDEEHTTSQSANKPTTNQREPKEPVILPSPDVVPIPLKDLPSIPHHDRIPNKLPPVPINFIDKEKVSSVPSSNNSPNNNQNATTEHHEPALSKIYGGDTNQSNAAKSNFQSSEPNDSSQTKVAKQSPQPPAVPRSWLKKSREPPSEPKAVILSPQLCVQSPEGVTIEVAAASALPQRPRPAEPLPSCSYVSERSTDPTLAPPSEPKEVEVRHPFIYTI